MLTDSQDRVYALETRGQFGYSCGFGAIKYGFSLFGFFSLLAGVYSLKHTNLGAKISRMAFYRPANPQTTAQQAWRAVFADGHMQWGTLTTDEKRAYNERATRSRMTGFNLFMREYLSAHKL